MTEIYSNINDEVREIAEQTWNIVLAQKNPIDAAEFLHNVTEYYKNILTDEDIEFLQFYFDMKMEMMKE